MSIWSASLLSATAANNMQVDAGTLLSTFDVTHPVKPLDEDIIAATTGDFNIVDQAEWTDFLEDVNNAPNGTKEGARITGRTRNLTVSIIEITKKTIKLALGAAEEMANGGVRAKRQVQLSDFTEMYWIGDMVDENKILVVHLKDSISTGGLNLTTSKNGKGNMNLTITPHPTIADLDASPMEYFLLEKIDDAAAEYIFTAVTPAGSENPKTEGWYVLSGDTYVQTNDTVVDANKTYYERTQEGA